MADLTGMMQAAAGAAGGEVENIYVEDVFSPYIYIGNGSSKVIKNDILLADGPTNGTSLHLTGDTLTDSAPIPNTFTGYGSIAVSTSVKKYGTGSIYFNGSTQYLEAPNNGALAFYDGDFTVELWLRTSTTTSTRILIGHSATSWLLGFSRTTLYWVSVYGVTNLLAVSASAIQDGNFHHVAVCRKDNVTSMYFDGVLKQSATDTTNYNNTAASYQIGDAGSTYGNYEGYIDDLRVTKGVALYDTSGFTPPSEALPIDTLQEGRGGLTWIKRRNSTTDYFMFDTERGATKEINSNTSNAEATNSDSLTEFTNQGFVLGADSESNANGGEFVSWTFRKAPKFFDIVTWTGNGDAVRTISHNLGSVPGCIMVKRYDAIQNWGVYHRGIAADAETDYLSLNNDTKANDSNLYWNDTKPTAESFTTALYNVNNGKYVAYLFAHDAGAFGDEGQENGITCGSYAGTSDITTNFVDLGYEPQFVLVKNITNNYNWAVFDTMRGASYTHYRAAQVNITGSEADGGTTVISPYPTGFFVRGNDSRFNASGSTYVYIAIRRGPMRPPTSGTQVFDVQLNVSESSGTRKFTNFPIDMQMLHRGASNSLNTSILSRVTGASGCTPIAGQYPPYLVTSVSTSTEDRTQLLADMWDNISFEVPGSPMNFNGGMYYSFARAPGFFDVVCYKGTGANRAIPHNLKAVPELMIVKARDLSSSWRVYANNDSTDYLVLASTDATVDDNTVWNDTSPTATEFTVGTSTGTNSTFNYVAYLFASLAGVSKVGTYTGNNSVNSIDCGFSNGARFVMIKRIDSTGNWFVWDSANGIIAGNDPYILLNTTDAKATATDYIDPLSSGFQITSSAPATINGSGGTFIFLAIA